MGCGHCHPTSAEQKTENFIRFLSLVFLSPSNLWLGRATPQFVIVGWELILRSHV